MLIRVLFMIGLALTLVACGSDANDSANATSEPIATEEASTETSAEAEATADPLAEDGTYQFELTVNYEIPSAWGGRAAFAYAEGWRIRDTSEDDRAGEVTLYTPDSYNISVSVNNDPQNDLARAESILDRLNQTAEIETRDVNGQTVLVTRTRGGNGLAATTLIDDHAIVFAEMVNTRGRDLEPMLATMLDILTSFEMTAAE